jgi:hypothetical protein
MFVRACSQPKLPIKTPRFVRKARRLQKKRDVQLKTLVDDISSIATQEVDRLRDIAKELLDNPNDNPIVIEDKDGYEEDDDN